MFLQRFQSMIFSNQIWADEIEKIKKKIEFNKNAAKYYTMQDHESIYIYAFALSDVVDAEDKQSTEEIYINQLLKSILDYIFLLLFQL